MVPYYAILYFSNNLEILYIVRKKIPYNPISFHTDLEQYLGS